MCIYLSNVCTLNSDLQNEILVNTETMTITKSGNVVIAFFNGTPNVHNSTLGLDQKYMPDNTNNRSILMENDNGHPVVAYFDGAKRFIAYDRIAQKFIQASDRLYGQFIWML